ncbi:MAG TPA: Mrp/NBP35 family ATP-binding protein [Nannocystaceae bacterium]|nr:Mrp/NBP35 family ATP-binding protein [Nannocystaceae bacterium]
MSTLTEQIRAALASVKDPATGQLVASSGQLAAVDVDDAARSARLRVQLISPGYPPRAQLEAALRGALEPVALARVEIDWELRVPQKPARADQNRLPTVKSVIAVAAGKGGVGKSTVSVNVAIALLQLGAKVGILDADIYGPSVPKMLGAPDSDATTAEGGGGIAPARYRGMPVMSVEYFVDPGQAVIWRGPMIHKLLTQFLEDVRWGELDYLVVDLPPGTGDAQLSLCQLIPITGAIVVTTPQEVALIDVRKAVNMFAKLEVPVLGVAENMSHYRCPACGHSDDIFGAGGGERLAREIGTELLARIPIDPRVAFGGDAGRPVVESNPDGDVAAAFIELAAKAALAASVRSATGPKRSSLLRTVQ